MPDKAAHKEATMHEQTVVAGAVAHITQMHIEAAMADQALW
jgi:hypothetical protein